jgi:hypothetical protein
MRKSFALFCSAVVLLIVMVISSAGSATQPRAYALQATETLPSEIPADTKTLEVGNPLTEDLSPDTSIRFYKFTGIADQKVRVSVEHSPDSDFFMTITVMDQDLQTVLGGTIGEALISGSVVVKLPANGLYIVSVEYGQAMVGTPSPGTYNILLSDAK